MSRSDLPRARRVAPASWSTLERITSGEVSRRSFLRMTTAAAGVAMGGPLLSACTPSLPDYPFTLGVASGDPLADRVVLWTRLAPSPLDPGGGMPAVPYSVAWEVAHDENFAVIARSGFAIADPGLGHSVHVDVPGLEPDRWYFYRFRAAGHVSDVGRTRTFPAAGAAPSLLRFASCSCQRYTDGFYTAYANMAAEDLDCVVHLGDYIYESGTTGIRNHDGTGEPRTLDEYRNRHALYKLDLDLQAAHGQFPWIVTWDDHEVDNNHAGLNPENPDPAFAARRAAAYRAYYEHMPVRALVPKNEFFRIYRDFQFGDLANLFVLDTRQYRTDQPCNDELGPACEGFPDPAGDMLGAAQENWLLSGLGASSAIWNVLAQQIVFSPTPIGPAFNFDQWDGYPFSRQRILDFIQAAGVRNPTVLTGDIHASGAGAVPVSADDLETPLGAEWVATGITSNIGNPVLASIFEQAVQSLPHVGFLNAVNQGYVRHEVTRDLWRADFRFVDSIVVPVAGISTGASWVAEEGVPGISEA